MMLSIVRWLTATKGFVRKERRTLLIVLVWALFFGLLIASDVLIFRGLTETTFGQVTDISFYRFRTQGVLDGQWLYRDIPCESPPLIVYFMIPAQLAGGGYLAYQVWFSIFVLLTSLTIYLGLRRFDDRLAFFSGLAFLFIPIGTVETVFGIQDEAIVIWVFILSIILAAIGRLRWSAFAIGVGIWIKLINALFYPLLWNTTPTRKEKMVHLGIVLGFTLAVCLPFLIVCPVEFLQFPLYYFLSSGPEAGPTGGLSIWGFLSMGGLELPSWFFLILIATVMLLAYLFAFRKRLTLLEGALVVLTAFVVIYSRSAAGYFMLPISLLILWGVEDRWMMVRCFVLYIPLLISGLFSANNPNGRPYVDVGWGWIVGAVLQLIVILILLDATRLALKRKNFVDRVIEKGMAH